jgi:hypothetical protein
MDKGAGTPSGRDAAEQVAVASALLEAGATIKLAALLSGLPLSRARSLAHAAGFWEGYSRPPLSCARLFAGGGQVVQASLFWCCYRGAAPRAPQQDGNLRAARMLLRAYAHYRRLGSLVAGEPISFNEAYSLCGQLALGAVKSEPCHCGAHYLRLSSGAAQACPVCMQAATARISPGAPHDKSAGPAVDETHDALPSVKALAYDPVQGAVHLFNTLVIGHIGHLARRAGHAEQLLNACPETIQVLLAHDHDGDSRFAAHERALFTARRQQGEAGCPAEARELEHTGLVLAWVMQFRQAARFDRNLARYVWGASAADMPLLLGVQDTDLLASIKTEGWRLFPRYPHPVMEQLGEARDDKAMRYAQARALLHT